MTIPAPDNDIFKGQGKRYGVHDFELELILKKVFETGSFSDELKSILTFGKIAYCDEIEERKARARAFDAFFSAMPSYLGLPKSSLSNDDG